MIPSVVLAAIRGDKCGYLRGDLLSFEQKVTTGNDDVQCAVVTLNYSGGDKVVVTLESDRKCDLTYGEWIVQERYVNGDWQR